MKATVLNVSELLEMVEALRASNLNLAEMPVLESPFAVTEKEVRRTWRERLFSRPWRPWVATKKVQQPTVFLGSTGYFNEWSAIVVHPNLAAGVRALVGQGV